MPEPEQIAIVVGEWVTKAENDLLAAAHTLTLGEDCPADTVCFHAQQCVEKYLKAFLVLKAIYFPKTHDIEKVVALLPAGISVSLKTEEQRRLTAHATELRYPGDYSPVTLAEARQSVAIARRIRREVRRLLPRGALRRKRK